ncbi:hypothetical protein ACB092_02G116900 [Castanea dentata]
MTSEAPSSSAQQFHNDTQQFPSSLRTAAERKIHNICVQTGEEFSTEFLQDRVAMRRLPRQPKRVGFNFNQNHQLFHEDLNGIVELQRIDSNCDSEFTVFVPGTRYGAEVEKKAYADSINRVYWEYGANGQVLGKFSDESNPDRGTPGPIAPPLYVVGSHQSHYPYGPGFSEGSFSGKMKFLCSFGGRILPRPTDSKLRYVGGETRIVSIRKSITWEELMTKTYAICNQPHTIKYQLPGEDLDALISVCSDEDLHHMLEEYQEQERIEGSQRLRMFLISLNESGSPSSMERRAAQPRDVDYQYVVAVNGIVDPPRKSSSGQSQNSQLGNTSDYSPTFHRDSPTSGYALETKDCSPSSLNKAGMFSNPASQFLTTLQIPRNSSNQSPPISPVQNRDPKKSNVQIYLDQPSANGHQGINPFVMEKLPYDNPYYVDAMGYCHNLPHGTPLMNYHDHYKYLVETDQANELNDRHFHYCIPSKDVHSPSYERQMIKERAFHSEKIAPNADDIMSLWSGPNDTDGSHRKLMHVFSDSQLQEHGERSNCNFPTGREKSTTFAMLNYAQELPIRCKERIRDEHQIDEYENKPTFKAPKDFKENFELGQEIFSWKDGITPYSDQNQQQFEGNFEVTSHDNVIELKNLPDLNCLPSVCQFSEELQSLREGISVPTIIPSERSADSMSECPCGYKLDATAPKVLIKSQRPDEDKQCATTETLSSQVVSDWYPGVLPVAPEELLDQESMVPSSNSTTSTVLSRETPVQKVELVIVEDVTDCTPPGIPLCSKIVPCIEDEDSDDLLSPRKTETENSTPESECEGVRVDGRDVYDSISDAAIAEMEAGIYGLQTIKNADLEELQELGSGTFGTVYHGKWRGTDVAIKRIKKSCFSGNTSEQERLIKDFWREAQILSTLHHPNVVAFYGVVPDGPGGTLATITEYMVNGSLRNVLIRKDRVLDRRKRLMIAMDAAFGMEYLHLKNIVHFDLKCDNLLVNLRDPERPICKVGDFGLSRIKRNTLVSGGVRGTLPWMAPELLNGSSSGVSEKVDVFSFGIAMWEILTGEEPYANMHCGAIIGGIVSNTLRPLIPKRCDPEWRKLMEECWCPHPEGRPSFTEITNRLRKMSNAIQKKRHSPANR